LKDVLERDLNGIFSGFIYNGNAKHFHANDRDYSQGQEIMDAGLNLGLYT
jgi:hypothetical protein